MINCLHRINCLRQRKALVLLIVQSALEFTVFLHIRPAGIIISHSLQMRVLLENTTFLLHT
jgi:hypothetical protein